MQNRNTLVLLLALGVACFVGAGIFYMTQQYAGQPPAQQSQQPHRVHDAAMEVLLSNQTDRDVWVYHSKSEPVDPLNLTDQQRKTVLLLRPNQADRITAQSHTELGDEHITLPLVFWTIDPDDGQPTVRGPIGLGQGTWEVSVFQGPSAGGFSITTTQIDRDPEVPSDP